WKTCTTEKDLTMDRLQELYNSLATCPAENTLVDDPNGFNTDDMGLGKTLTMISLIIKTKEMDSGCEPKKTWDGVFRKGICIYSNSWRNCGSLSSDTTSSMER
ncbi:lodestar, partial [Carabus blaptoides fortunei]